jgi:hypothetical protein
MESGQSKVLIFLEFFDRQTAFRALIRHFDRPFGRLPSTVQLTFKNRLICDGPIPKCVNPLNDYINIFQINGL